MRIDDMSIDQLLELNQESNRFLHQMCRNQL